MTWLHLILHVGKYLKWLILILYPFNREKSSKFPVHLNASHSNLHDNTWKDIFYLEHKHLMTNRDSFADKFHSALDRLKNTTKLVLLHHLSTQLKKNVGNHPLLMRFHMFAMTLEAKYGSNDSVVPERRWSNEDGRYKERKTKFGHVRKKRTLFQEEKENSCQDLRSDPNNNDCLGMCGYGCSCWYFICGNCCQNQLCFEHDKCCRHDMYTINCLIPIVHSLSCEDGYGGYPSCLQWVHFTLRAYRFPKEGGKGEGGRVNLCWVCASGLLEPLPHYSIFCCQL